MSPGSSRTRRAEPGLTRWVALVLVVLAGCGGSPAPAPEPQPGARVSAPQRQGDVLVSEVTFPGAHGDPVHGLLARPADGAARECVVYQGGLGSAKEDAAGVWPAFAALGAATFTIDARAQGRDADPAQLAAAGRDPQRLRALFADTVTDLRRGLDYLTTDAGCRRVAYVGFSFGGITGALLTGADDRVDRAALVSAGGDWPRLLRASTVLAPGFADRPAAQASAAKLLAPLDPARAVARIAPRPLLLVNGTADPVIPPASAAALRRAAPEAETVVYRGGHDPFSGPARDRVVRAISRFLRPA